MAEILHQFIDSLSHYLKGFIHPRWLVEISAINSISQMWAIRNDLFAPPQWPISRLVLCCQHQCIERSPRSFLNSCSPDMLQKLHTPVAACFCRQNSQKRQWKKKSTNEWFMRHSWEYKSRINYPHFSNFPSCNVVFCSKPVAAISDTTNPGHELVLHLTCSGHALRNVKWTIQNWPKMQKCWIPIG